MSEIQTPQAGLAGAATAPVSVAGVAKRNCFLLGHRHPLAFWLRVGLLPMAQNGTLPFRTTGNRENYLRDGLGLEPDAVDWALAGLRVCGVAEPVPFRNAMELGKRGRPKRGEEKGDGITFSRGSTGADYLAARIRRDAPEIAARMGEFGRACRAVSHAVPPPPSPRSRRTSTRVLYGVSQLTAPARAWAQSPPRSGRTRPGISGDAP